jgi:uncharacterized membrane protein YfcA
VLEAGLAIVAVLVGAAMQRATGMGFALLSAPFIVLLLGPVSGIALVNLCGALTSAVILFRVWRDVRWRRFLVMLAAALVGIVPAVFVLLAVSAPVLEIGVGSLVVVGLTVMLLLRRGEARHRTGSLAVAGVASGFMNTTAGVGGPAMSVYAVATGWDQRSFAATLQPYFLAIGLASLAAKAGATPDALSALPWQLWAGVAVACVIGLLLGEALAARMSPRLAQRLLIVVSYIGGVVTIGRGIWTLL